MHRAEETLAAAVWQVASPPRGVAFAVAPRRLLTASHLCHDDDGRPMAWIDLLRPGGPPVRARVLLALPRHQNADLALLGVDEDLPAFLPVAPLDAVDDLRGNVEVLAWGTEADPSGAHASRVVRLPGRVTDFSNVARDDLIMFCAGIEPGDSGAPLLDAAGRVVGVVRGALLGGDVGTAVPLAAFGWFAGPRADLPPSGLALPGPFDPAAAWVEGMVRRVAARDD